MFSNNHYNKNLQEFARELRTQSVSRAEKYIWKALLSKHQMGIRVLRQRPIDNFIVDFFSPEIKLIIEIDGNSHFNRGEYDQYRQDKLVRLGYKFIRFKEGDVLNNLDEVRLQLIHVIESLQNNLD